MQNAVLEIACFNIQSAIVAQAAGADRIELCRDYTLGGLTPLREVILLAKEQLHLPFFVMVRCREGNFVYNEEEINEMCNTVLYCKNLGVTGIVFGALTANNHIDLNACKKIIEAAEPMQITFHRAIDACVNANEGIEEIISLGFTRVLSSGLQKNALLGSKQLNEWQHRYQNKLGILPGGGIRAANIGAIRLQTGCSEFHSAAITSNAMCCDADEIKNMKQVLSQHD